MQTEMGKHTFPCEFSFKVIGNDSPEFESEVLAIFRQHFPQMGEGAITQKNSKNNKYLALTVTVTATSQEQVDATYKDLSANPNVLFAL
jgi:putative lipoic acid-binding regulatory protein